MNSNPEKSSDTGTTHSKDLKKKDNHPPHKFGSKAWWIENITSLSIAFILVFAIRSSLIEAFKIPSGSMIPTLHVGDHIFVNKLAYGLKVPFTEWVLSEPMTMIKRDAPKRGEVIVFKFPRDESFYYIKRVVGTPGDTLEMRDRVLYVNGEMVAKTPASDKDIEKVKKDLKDTKYAKDTIELFNEQLGSSNHLTMTDKSQFMGDNFGPVTVPSESLFVMGDNRDYSNDSRFWGFVPFKNVRGKALFVWWSMWISLSEDETGSSFKPGRIGTLIR